MRFNNETYLMKLLLNKKGYHISVLIEARHLMPPLHRIKNKNKNKNNVVLVTFLTKHQIMQHYTHYTLYNSATINQKEVALNYALLSIQNFDNSLCLKVNAKKQNFCRF